MSLQQKCHPFVASDDGRDFGKESKDSAEDQVGPKKHELDSAWLLQHLQARYNEIADAYGYSKDLPTYLEYCRDVVFAGSEPSYGNHEEEKMIEYLWNFYQNEEDTKPPETTERSNTPFNKKRLKDKGCIGRTSKKEKIRKKGSNVLFPNEDTRLEDDLPRSVDNNPPRVHQTAKTLIPTSTVHGQTVKTMIRIRTVHTPNLTSRKPLDS